MCRFVAYLGEPIVLDEMLFLPDSSIVEQSVHPQLLSAMNLAGFGVLAWDAESADPNRPWTYRTAGPGEQVVLTGGGALVVDAIYAGMFELPGE